MADTNIVLFTDDLFDEVTALAYEFAHNHNQPALKDFPVDMERIVGFARNYLEAPQVGFVAVNENDGVVGVLFARLGHPPFSLNTIVYEDCFYVKPEYRTKFVFNKLLDAMLTWAECCQANSVRLTVESGIDLERFGRLVGHYGFRSSGETFTRAM